MVSESKAVREILFRGQTRRKGEKVRMLTGEKLPGNWVYGGIFPGNGDFSVIYGGNFETLEISTLGKHVVYSDTVGQYTGVTDKNGTKIFEGDILEYCSPRKVGTPYIERCVVEWGGHRWEKKNIWACDWTMDFNCLNHSCDLYQKIAAKYATVIGNIHDNPELLEGNHG